MEEKRRYEIVSNSQALRKNMTKEERHLWYDFLKELPFKVHRQYVVGEFILDFYIPCAKLCIEVDGNQHYKSEIKEHDRKRTDRLSSRGIRVVRYDNREINGNFKSVCDSLTRILDEYL